MTLTPGNLTLPGPCKIYVGTASAAQPASSVAYGTAWGGSWTEVGLTLGGAEVSLGMDKITAKSDQYNAGHLSQITSQVVAVKFAVAESTLTQLKQALGYGTLTAGSTESTFGVAGNETFVAQYAIGLESYAPNASSTSAKYSRFIVWKAEPKGDEVVYGVKKDEQRVYAYSYEGMVDTTQSSSEQLWKLIERQV